MSDTPSPLPGVPAPKGVMKLVSRDGQFSKTALFAVLGNVLVLGNYMLQSWLAGASYDFGFLKGSIPVFSSGDAMAILSILNATYVSHAALSDRAPE